MFTIFIFPKNEKPLHNGFRDLNRVDWTGCLLSLAAILLLIFALESGGNEFYWNSTPIVSSLVGASACLLLFILWEAFLARGPKDSPTLALYPFRLFQNWKLNAALM